MATFFAKGIKSFLHRGSSKANHISTPHNIPQVPQSNASRKVASAAVRPETATSTSSSGLRTQRTLEGAAAVTGVAASAGVAVVGVTQAKNFGDRLLNDTEEGVRSLGHTIGDGLGAALHSTQDVAHQVSNAVMGQGGQLLGTVAQIVVPIVVISGFAYTVYEVSRLLATK